MERKGEKKDVQGACRPLHVFDREMSVAAGEKGVANPYQHTKENGPQYKAVPDELFFNGKKFFIFHLLQFVRQFWFFRHKYPLIK